MGGAGYMQLIQGIAGAVGGTFQGIGARKAQRSMNEILQRARGELDAKSVRGWAAQMYPGIYDAYGQQGWQDAMARLIGNPGYVDPRLKNYGFQMSAQRGHNDLQRSNNMFSKAGAPGGMARMGSLAAAGAQTNRDTAALHNWGMYEEDKFREDTARGMDFQLRSGAQALTAKSRQADIVSQERPPLNWATIIGNAHQSGLAAFSGTPQTGNEAAQNPVGANFAASPQMNLMSGAGQTGGVGGYQPSAQAQYFMPGGTMAGQSNTPMNYNQSSAGIGGAGWMGNLMGQGAGVGGW